MNREERPIVYTITQITRNFGGLYTIKTYDKRCTPHNYTDVGVTQLFAILEIITQDLNDEGYSVVFEVD
jgi:hypothetical protein